MPRKSQKKQTRLAFAPAAASASGEGSEDHNDRFARVSYGYPSLAAMRPGTSRKSTSEEPKKKLSKPSKSSKPSKRTQSPDRPAEPPTQEAQSMLASPRVAVEISSISPLAKAHLSKQAYEEESSDDDIVVPSSHRKRRAPTETDVSATSPAEASKRSTRKSKRNVPSKHDADADDSVEEISRPRRRLKRKAESSPIVLSNSDESEEPVPSSPVKRRRRAADPETPQTSQDGARRDQMDIEEDLRDLQDSVVKKSRTRGRLAESARDKRLKHLEALRRRRAGQKEVVDIESTSTNEQDESEDENDAPPSRIAYQGQEDDSDVESAIPSNEDLDRYEDDFVLEDDNAELGVPTEEIPFEFTRHAYKQPKEYFRDVVAWMVHNRLDPAFPRSDAMYEMAFMKLEDEVKGRAGSQLISSVWDPDFRRALLARPHMEQTSFPTEFNHTCDACRRSNHPANTDMKLYGKAYSLQTLEPLIDESDEDQSEKSGSEVEEDSGVERDRDGYVLPAQEKRFYLGRHCRDKAQLAHTLTHWRYHLNEWVIDYLERMGHMDDAEVLRRNNLSQKRKSRNAIDVITDMVEAGEVDKLWRDFHTALKAARETSSILGR